MMYDNCHISLTAYILVSLNSSEENLSLSYIKSNLFWVLSDNTTGWVQIRNCWILKYFLNHIFTLKIHRLHYSSYGLWKFCYAILNLLNLVLCYFRIFHRGCQKSGNFTINFGNLVVVGCIATTLTKICN